MHYKNFKTVVYIPAWNASKMTKEKLEADYEFIEKYIGLDKVYLETHRNDIDIEKDQLLMIKSFLESKGVTVSGGITYTVNNIPGADDNKHRLFGTFCYTEPLMREKVKQIAEYTASIFDEIILDDFYFTFCKCDRCIKEKGDRDWVSFRKELMTDVSKNLVVGPAKAVNPNVKMIIKYPNWRESFHFTGYLPEVQQDIFDGTYIGTETRSPKYTDQHLPEYLSYALVRYMENAWPGRNGGGWFDTYQCWSADRYMEQAYLTAFAKAQELMFFMWDDLIDNRFVGAMKYQLDKIDNMLEGTGKPTGLATYIPHASNGENHIEMRLGMLGIPIDMTPDFPKDKKVILLTESSAADENVVEKLRDYAQAGGTAVVTTGFVNKVGDKLREAGITEAEVTGRKINVTRYQITDHWTGYIDDAKPVHFPEIVHGNNASWSLLNGGDGDYHTSLLLLNSYGMGAVCILSIPDNYADIYSIPSEAIDVLKRLVSEGVYASGKDFSMFTYDDGSMILYKYVKGDVRPSSIKIYNDMGFKKLKNTVTGEEYDAQPYDQYLMFEKKHYMAVDIMLEPGIFHKFIWHNE